MKDLQEKIFKVDSRNFEALCLSVFRYQYENCPVYQEYINLLELDLSQINTLKKIPFLPISAFKSHTIQTGKWKAELVFSSSGTSGEQTSRHLVREVNWYKQSFRKAFQEFYGSIEDYSILALLPAYLEREGSSLIYMIEDLIQQSKNATSGFYLYNHDELFKSLESLRQKKQKTLLVGVSFALLDFAEKYKVQSFPELVVMETGGMKGRRKEITRPELHESLGKAFNQKNIHSEYGMTELLSQAYAKESGLFACPNWMSVLIRQQDDPFSYCKNGEIGGINIVDLANIDSCSFLQSDDLGRLHENGEFEVLGRFDQSDIRGCSLLI